MAVIGSATLNIVPKVVGGLSNAINGEISKANVSGLGKSAGAGFMGGFASGASIGVWSSVASKAIDVVVGSLDAAASRVDTLNNYPRIMESLGASTGEANRSIATMSDALQNVPTRLDDMATTVQGLYAATQRYGTSLGTVTDAGLALNSMLLAGGQSQTIVNAAMEQFRQMVSKGKPELQDWKSLIQAAPGQLNQLAKEMLDTSATADDLYAALGGGKESDYDGPFEWGSLGMDEFIEKLAGMRGTFEKAAEEAQGGIGTAFANMQNAVTRGVADVLDAFGQERIASAIGDVKTSINDAFGEVKNVMPDIVPVVQGMWDKLKGGAAELGPVLSNVFEKAVSVATTTAPHLAGAFDAVVAGMKGIAPIASGVLDVIGKLAPVAAKVIEGIAPILPMIANIKVGMATLSGAQSLLGAAGGLMSSVMERAGGAASLLNAGLGKASEGLLNVAMAAGPNALGNALLTASDGVGALAGTITGPMVLAGGAAVAAIAAIVQHQEGLRQSAERGQQAITGFSDAVSRTDALDSYGSSLDGVGQVARDTTDYLADMTGRWQRHADAIASNNETAAESIATWTKVRDTINDSIGATDLSSEAYGRLKWAIEKYNEATGESLTVDQVTSGFEGQADAVDALKAKVQELTQARIDDARVSAYQSNLEEAYKAQADAQREVADAQGRFNEVYQGYLDKARDGEYELKGITAEQFAYNAALSDASTVYVDVNGEQMRLSDAMRQAEQHLRDSSQAASDYEARLGEMGKTTAETADAFTRITSADTLLGETLSRQGVSADLFAERLRELGGNVEANAQSIENLSGFQLTQLASSFDGTSASIARCLDSMDGWGGSFDEAAVKAAYASQEMSSIRDALGEIGVNAEQMQSVAGTSLDELASKLVDAGVSTQTLSAVGAEGFAALADACQGNVDLMVGSLAMYNATPVEEKDGQVVVNDAPLMDAQGHIYTYNGQGLEDKQGTVTVDYVELSDSTGAVFVWNGTTLSRKVASATANGNVVTGQPTGRVNDLNNAMRSMSSRSVSADVSGSALSAAGSIWNTVSAINSLYSKSVEIVTTHVDQHVSKADGGHVLPRHASGYFATGPTLTNWGLVGEDGDEVVLNNDSGGSTVIPLTNKRYAKPFVDMVAEGLAERVGQGRGASVVVNLNYDAGARANDMARDVAREMGRILAARG